MSTPFLTSLDLLSVSSTTRSLPSSCDASVANGGRARAGKAQLPDRLNFYLSSSSLPSPAESVSNNNKHNRKHNSIYPASPPPPRAWGPTAMPHVATKSEGDLSGLLQMGRSNAFALSSTADYHNSLLDQHRHTIGHRASSSHGTNMPNPARQWLPMSNIRRAGVHSSNENAAAESGMGGTSGCPRSRKRRMTMMNKKKERKSQSQGQNTIQGRSQSQRQTMGDLAVSPQPPLTRQDVEEFEALPIAVRRKYFSTLERLRFAQTSDILDHPPRQQARRGRGPHPIWTNQRPTTSPACWDHPALLESLSLAKLPAKIREKHLTREEQLLVAKQLRESVILDAADEAFYKIGRRASPQVYTPTLSSSTRPSSMASIPSDKQSPGLDQTHDALYDSFRWLDEDEDLDLSLAVDDYHANLKEPMPLPTPDPPAPSFRRRLSMSKMPFGRASMSSSRPATKDATCSPSTPTPSSVAYPPQHLRRKSRAFSLMAPKHESQTSVASFDPAAVHYQDPEARLKLRVYLASPQKFDEAVEFGFPSNDIRSAGPSRGVPDTGRGFSHTMMSPDSENFKTFLEDDQSSTYSEDASMPDPESPKTPDTPENHSQMMRPLRFPEDGVDHQHQSRAPEGYAQAPAASREFTLRMTLTRPDLRACEDPTYQGWQTGPQQQSGRVSRASRSQSRTDGPIPNPPARSATKESMDRIFADIDQEMVTQSDGGVVKRFWNRVRRN